MCASNQGVHAPHLGAVNFTFLNKQNLKFDRSPAHGKWVNTIP